MKNLVCKLFLIPVLSISAFTVFAAPASRVAVIDRVNVKIEPVHSANVDYSGSIPTSPGSRKYVNSWNMISVDFFAGHKNADNQKKSGEQIDVTDSRNHLDNMVITVRAVCESASEKNVNRNVLFSGSCKLWTLNLDGKKHTVLFFLPPMLLDRYYVPKSTYGTANIRRQSVRGKNVKSDVAAVKLNKGKLALEVVISADNGTRELAREYLNVKGSKTVEKQREFNKLIGKVPNNYNFEGAVLSKGQSPWAYFKFDQFDLEKKTAR